MGGVAIAPKHGGIAGREVFVLVLSVVRRKTAREET
jgi:hypothetical protein